MYSQVVFCQNHTTMEIEFFEQDKKTLTPEHIRKYPAFNINGEEALKFIETPEKLAPIMFEFDNNINNI